MGELALAAEVMDAADVARLTRSQRDRRLDDLLADAFGIYDEAVRVHVTEFTDKLGRGRTLAATFLLFSGGNDSTVLSHLFRGRATHAVHANTGIGVEETRQYVRDTAAAWGLPLLERHPPAGSTFRDLVIERGFPGPAQHWKMYQRLKLRALEQAQREVLTDPMRQRVVFLAGRRRAESQRRTTRDIPAMERRRSAVWVSPLVNWTSLDMNTYRLRFPDCPRNPVSDTLHMSGECLCGSFAKRGELDEVGAWYPQVRAQIEELERAVAAAGIPAPQNRWGWGAYRSDIALHPDQLALWADIAGDDPDPGGADDPFPTGPMCSSCPAPSEHE